MALQPKARPAFVALVEEHLQSLVRNAVTVQRHCKRARLIVGGSGSSEGGGVTAAARLHASDVNLALQLQGSEKLYGVQLVGDPQEKIQLQEMLQQTSYHDNDSNAFLSAPHEVALQQQWLAVDGEVPDSGTATSSNMRSSAAINTTQQSSSWLPADSLLRVHQLQASLLSEELKLYYHRVTTTLEAAVTNDDANAHAEVDAILARLATDRGLQELVPFLVLYSQQQMLSHLNTTTTSNTTHHSSPAAASITAVRLCRSLLHNRHLHLELHLQELLPCWITCVAFPSGTHYELRRQAASALVECLVRYGADYATLKPGVLRGLVQHTLQSNSRGSRYGGWTAIGLLGHRAIRAFLLPVAAVQWYEWERDIRRADNTRGGVLVEQLHMCQQALLQAVSKLQRCEHADDPMVEDDPAAANLLEALGDRTVAWARSTTTRSPMAAMNLPDYHACFV